MLSWKFLTDDLSEDALLLDCRSEAIYEQGTVSGAYGVDFIKKPYGSGPRSQGKLAGFLQALKEIFEKSGKTKVIAFDEGAGMYASRMAWILMGTGLSQVQIYSRKFTEIPPERMGPGAGQIVAEPLEKPLEIDGITHITGLQQNLTRVQLLDVRTPEEYRGELPRMSNPEPGSICGRIPGSVNWDWRVLYDNEGRLKSKGDIVMDIRRIGLIQERPTVIYDFNGARSCTTALVLSQCGYRQVSVYLGSWMEWRKSKLPKQNVSTYAEAMR